jgi:hypothetical protein
MRHSLGGKPQVSLMPLRAQIISVGCILITASFQAVRGVPAHLAAPPDACLALAVGAELPDSGGAFALWQGQATHLHLTKERSRWAEVVRPIPASVWLKVSPAPFLGADTIWITSYPPHGGSTQPYVDTVFMRALAFAWVERSDSIFFAGSGGWWTHTATEGRWRGDTLVARIHISYDTPSWSYAPRANVFGIKYSCMDFLRAREAAASVVALAKHDTADVARDKQERDAERKDDEAQRKRLEDDMRRDGIPLKD